MTNFVGDIIEESLENKDVLKKITIISTRVEKVTVEHKTPWISQWTLYTVEIPENQARAIAEELRTSLDHDHAWYADFKNETYHYIIFRDKVFYIERKSNEQYEQARQYGLSLGIPEYQLDFRPDNKMWER